MIAIDQLDQFARAQTFLLTHSQQMNLRQQKARVFAIFP